MKSQKPFTHQRRLHQDFQSVPVKDKKTEDTPKPVQCYAIGQHGQIIKRFDFIKASGRRYSFSYSLLPIFIQEDSSLLYVKSHDLLIEINGYNLDPIMAYLNCEQLLWAKESPSGKSEGTTDPFIKEISLRGKAIATAL